MILLWKLHLSHEWSKNLHKKLGKSEVSAQWVPWLLTPDQKRIRMVMSQVNLAIFEANSDGFCKHFVTQDECWVHHFEAETEQ